MFRNDGAVLELAGRLVRGDAADEGASSHWTYMHQTFLVSGDGSFSGLRGVEGFTPRRSVMHQLAHALLQRKYAKFGRPFPDWPRFETAGKSICRRLGSQFDLAMIRQALTLSMLKHETRGEAFSGTVVVIGDGFAAMTNLILDTFPSTKVVFVNLAKTLLADVVSVRRANPDVGLVLATSEDQLNQALGDPGVRAVGILATDSRFLASVPASLFINIVSMQEMDPDITADYFNIMRMSPTDMPYFYCCNRVEKELPDGTTTRIMEYPWAPTDDVIIDGLCPWHQDHYAFSAPFYRPYDGPIWHRLCRLANIPASADGPVD